MAELMLKEESFAVIGAAMVVYNEMGNGFLELVYQECMEIELKERRIPFMARGSLALKYKGHALNQKYVPDLICYGQIIVELKAVNSIVPEHKAQVINYLKASGMKLGLLVNFGARGGLQFERVVW